MWYDVFFKKNQNLLLEAQDEFKRFHPKKSYKDIIARAGEGMEELQPVSGYGLYGKNEVKSFNLFYNSYIDFQLKNEREKIKNYRTMARMPEIGEVLEDVVTESTQTDFEGKKLKLIIRDSEISNNDNISKMLQKEFEILFHDRLKINKILDELFMTYYIDGRVYWENIIDINNPDSGIIGIKKLPTETMDFVYNVITGKVEFYVQYLREGNIQLPPSIDQAKNTKDLICFFPEQISYIDYGQYGANKKDVFGYLEKVKAPYNQVKLLESAVVIYRLVRAPERLVFTIDVGNLPREKAMKLVEKIKLKMQRKETYDPSTGSTTSQPDVMCIRKNTLIPLLDGRNLSLQEIVDEYNQGKQNYVYSINRETLNIEPGKIVNAKITRLNEPLIRIHLDNGTYIDTTYDHKFIKRDNTDCRADELQVGDSLMPLKRGEEQASKSRKRLYETIYDPGTGKFEFTHILSSNYVNGKKEYGEVVHHIDFNPRNNNPDNLKRMGYEEHFKYHSTLAKENWENNHDEMAQRIKNGIDEWRKDPENRKRHSEWVIKTNKEQNKVVKMAAVLNVPAVRAKQKEAAKQSRLKFYKEHPEYVQGLKDKKTMILDPYIKQYMVNKFVEYYRPSRDKLLKILSADNHFMRYLEKINEKQQINNKQFTHINKKTLLKVILELGYSDYSDFRNNYKGERVPGYSNHKIVKIEYLDEKDDCGCITVEGNHNFATTHDNGNIRKDMIFIRNSILENYFLPTSCIIPTTYVSLLDGRELPMSEIIKEYEQGKENWVYSVNKETKRVIPGKIKWAGYTRKNAELVRVHLDNGKFIDCTPDHKFILRNGEEVEAQNLEKKSELSSKDSQINVLKVEKLDYRKDTCCLTIEDPGENHNFALTAGVFIKNSDGRGSSVSSIGGNPSGFTELDDLYYFHRKMYRALKYPLSRVDSIQEKQSRDDLYQKTSSGEITRDEVKWGRFLKYHQDKFSEAFLDLFLLHLNLKGIKKEFNIKRSKLYCEMTVPNNFISQMNQLEQETRWSNYNSSNSEEFSKYWRMKKYLKLTDEEILANSTGFKKDQELGFAPAEEQY